MTRKEMTIWIRRLPLLVLIPSILLNLFLLTKQISFQQSGVKVIGVIDGDTLVLEGKSRVRLRFIDAPDAGLCGYTEASKELKKLVMGKSVRIEETIPDQYGRGMALVYIGNQLVNKEMLSSGWVRYHSDNASVVDSLKEAVALAKSENRGVYSKCQSTDTPDNPKCVIKGNIDDNSTRRNYYLPACAQYKFTIVEKDMGENWFCSEKEAIAAGFTRAKTCK